MSDIVEQATPATENTRKERPFPALLPSIGWIALYFALQVIVTVGIISTSLVAEKMADPAIALNPATAADNPMLPLLSPLSSIDAADIIPEISAFPSDCKP